jgi:hypothetical protein
MQENGFLLQHEESPETAQITELGLVAETTNPSFVVMRANAAFSTLLMK